MVTAPQQVPLTGPKNLQITVGQPQRQDDLLAGVGVEGIIELDRRFALNGDAAPSSRCVTIRSGTT